MFGGLGMGEMILIFLVVLLLFGAKRLPEIGSSLGKGIKEFKSSVREIEGELKAPRAPYAPPLPPQQQMQIPPAAPQSTAQPSTAQPSSAPQAQEKQAAQG